MAYLMSQGKLGDLGRNPRIVVEEGYNAGVKTPLLCVTSAS